MPRTCARSGRRHSGIKQFLQKALESRDSSKDKLRITLVTTLPELEESEGKFTDNERKTVQQVLGKDHRVVKVEWDRHGEGKHMALIFIRLQGGKASVVGVI
jgi:hypothetical protein